MNKIAILMATMLAVATVFATGLTILPESVQSSASVFPIPIGPGSGGNPCNIFPADIDADEISNNCDFYGNTEIDASTELSDGPP